MAHNNHHVLGNGMAVEAETFAYQPFDPVAFVRALYLAFGDNQPQAGMRPGNATPQNGEIAIATFAFRGVEYGVEFARLRQS